MIRLAAALILASSAAFAQSPPTTYLVFPDCDTAIARDMKLGGLLHLVSGPWHNIVKLVDGRCAVEYQPSGQYSTQHQVLGPDQKPQPVVSYSSVEKAAILDRPTMGTLLSDIIPSDVFLGKLTKAQVTAAAAVADKADIPAKLSAIQKGAAVDLQDPATGLFIAGLAAEAIVDGADVDKLLTPQPVPDVVVPVEIAPVDVIAKP